MLFAAIGLLSAAREAGDYFACGRRVPAFFNGLVLGISALGGAGFLALTGAFFSVGFDALCLSLGFCAGFVFMGVLLAPFLRKFGAYTIPTYLGRRFESRRSGWLRPPSSPCRSCCCSRPRPGSQPMPRPG